jgi:hypothetical protein
MDDDDIEIIIYGRNFSWVAVDGAKRMRANARQAGAASVDSERQAAGRASWL